MIALVTATKALVLDEDMAPLSGAISLLGGTSEVVVWDDSSVDWTKYSVAIIRSTWDYHNRYREFLEWVNKVSTLTTLHNNAEVIRWNTDKRYLDELSHAGIATVPMLLEVEATEPSLFFSVDTAALERFARCCIATAG